MTTLPAHTFAGSTTVLPAFEDVAVPPIRVSIKGKVYEIPPMPIDVAIVFRDAAAGNEAAFEKYPDADALYRAVLGPLYDELVQDKVPEAAVDRVLLTAMADHSHGRIHAEGIWALGPDPELHREYVDVTRRMWLEAQEQETPIDTEAT
jgi:hypothetical protein